MCVAFEPTTYIEIALENDLFALSMDKRRNYSNHCNVDMAMSVLF